jgi:cation diffusion facilitator family transporter
MVVALTLVMMVGEIAAGAWTGSMALTADGWHMATHAGALALSALAYWYARTRARRADFSFGTGKVFALSGFVNALLLMGIALWMGIESVERLLQPTEVRFSEALPVAVLGLVVNLVSAALLGHGHDHGHSHGHDHTHGHGHGHEHETKPNRSVDHSHGAPDHNLRAAYMHVVADAVTSVLAILALVLGRYVQWTALDPLMGVLGSVLVGKWAVGLLRATSGELLDVSPCLHTEERVRKALEAVDDVGVVDLHLWQMGPGRWGLVVSLYTAEPRETAYYRRLILSVAPVSPLTVEVNRCEADHAPATTAPEGPNQDLPVPVTASLEVSPAGQ